MRFRTTASIIAAGILTAAAPAQADDWSAVYIGIGAAIGAANHELALTEAPGIPFDGALSIDGLGGDGGVFTLGVGADYQVNSRFVVGAFFDYDWMSLDTDVLDLTIGDPVNVAANVNVSVEDMWSIGGKLGYIVSPSTLLFVTAGYSRADISDINAGASFGGGGGSIALAHVGEFDGYFIGGGAEVKLSKAISVKGEYRYTDLDSETLTLLPGTPFVGINDLVRTTLDPDIQTGRVSLNYRFGLGRGEADEPAVTEASVGSWSQFYIGAGGTYTFGNNELTLSPGPVLDPFGVDAALSFNGLGSQGGGYTFEIGADRQYDDKFVFGVFVDYTRHDNEYEIGLNLDDLISGSLSYKIEDQFSVGGRAGYLVTPATLVFGTLGYTHLSLSDTVVAGEIDGIGAGSFVLAKNGSFDGFFLGAGFETKLTDRLSLKAEYRYVFADSDAISLLPGLDLGGVTANDFVTAELDPDIQSVRLSLDYRFDFGRSESPLK